MNRLLCRLAFAMLVALALVPFTTSITMAHGHTEAGDYEIVIGFHNEPAYQGEPNGLDLFVTNKKTGEKVNGLEDTLKAEISFGGSKKELKLRAQWGEDGAYTADVLPTEAGDYTWHIWGDINGAPVDVSMTSSPTTFGSVEAKNTVAFPASEATPAELQAQTSAAQHAAQTALLVGIVGIIFGVIGTIVGILGLRSRTKAARHVGQLQRVA
ncbi:MAG TPA: hypothetical protein VFT66_17830 [Roseiflexaceae bacterium]|nr:hypothetical protein [Roseiflexaceae bacterium]